MATKQEKKLSVFVFENVWKDRHGDEGTNVKVFSTKKKAMDYFKKDVKNYLENYYAISDGKIDTSVIDSINGDTIDEDTTLDDLMKLASCDWLDINVDSSGTNASWSVSKMAVM